MTPRNRLAALAAVIVLTTAPAAAFAAESPIRAPGTVDPGQQVQVTVEAAQAGGRFEVWGPDIGRGFASRAVVAEAEGGAAVLTAPGEPGTYELRYLDASGRVVARKSFDVAALPVSLAVPDPLGAGYAGKVVWRGPAAAGDMIQIADPASGRVLSEAPALGSSGAPNTTMLRVPEVSGTVEIRYWHGASGSVLRTLAVAVGGGTGWLRAPVEVEVGRRFTVEWMGPASSEQAYELVEPGSGAVIDSRPAVDSEGKAVAARFKAPKRPGQYRVRYVNTGTGFVLADLPLDVDPR